MSTEKRIGDRRRKGILASFPLLDKQMSIVRQDRRSNTDRRINQAKLRWQQSQPIVSVNLLVLTLGGKVIQLNSDSPDSYVGRAPSCNVVLDNPYVSHKHACISWQNGVFLLTDHSRNGTYVDTDDVGCIHLRNELIFLTGKGSISFGMPIVNCPDINVLHYTCE